MSTSAMNGVIQGQTAQQTPNTVAEPDAFNRMDLGQFIKLLVAEMQNQDPMNPMDNAQILQQISQIKAIASNDKLSNTLTSMQLQQDMTSASVLLNQTITGLNADSDTVTGKVDSVSVAGGKVQLRVGTDTIDLKNVARVNGATSQDVATGNSLLNRIIRGLNAMGQTITGRVSGVTVADSKVQLQVGNDTVDLDSVTKIDEGT
jgi:flagellar basal-body rod modification protein FlgD